MSPATPFPTFRDASDAVLAYLQEHYPMGLWMVTRTVGDDWIVLRALDDKYEVDDGDLFRWSDSFCSRMVQGEGPNIAPDSHVIPAYAAAPIGQQIPIASYIGFPLEADGELFGTLCAIDTETKPQDLSQADEIIALLARMLSTILQADMRANRLTALAESLADAAHRDSLTGALNRRGWESLMEKAEVNRSAFGQTHCVVMADLHGLKIINERYGHAAGDRMLMRAADTITNVTRGQDVVARIGGDEFAVLLEEPESLSGVDIVARLREALTTAGVNAAVGFAFSSATESIEQAAREADLRMYRDKNQPL